MALSQVQCLDEHHVNLRVSESKPEFFYSEDQRLGLEALITRGRDAFTEYLQKHGVREFLSEPELEWIERTAEAYRPGHEHHQKAETPTSGPAPGNTTPGSGEEAGDGEVSLQYWPDRSEFSVAELDLGWPEAISYRGVTRVTVYTQPPAEGQTHIKEVVRKCIASAQRVIAVVMDAFTDVDIFRDLLDAAYKRKVPVYIIIDTAAVPCFLSMCGRADMHRGHLKNLRVRCCGGVEFFTRSAQRVRGSLSQKFLLVDGDKAISGSYSFTWSSSRFDRNLITAITGQAVETFDLQFRELYFLSRGVSLNKVSLAEEPLPDPVPQAAPAPVPASVARKLINPKYALVAAGTQLSPSSSDQNSSNKNSNTQNPPGLILKKRHKITEEPPMHPGLVGLERAYLIPYLPTWPEPDPPSDVIGFINIRDETRAHKVHLQRSERFEVSQAIRFRAPLTLPAQNEEPASGPVANEAGKANSPSGNPSTEASTNAASPTKKQSKEKKHTAANTDHTETTDSRAPPQQPSIPLTEDIHKPNTQTPTTQSNVTDTPQPTDNTRQTTESQNIAPPIPKRRTLQLVIDPSLSEKSSEAQVTLVKMDQVDELANSNAEMKTPEDVRTGRSRIKSKANAEDSGSNEDGSQDSTKVNCDRAANDDPSSNSTASEEEFYDAQPEQKDPLINGVTLGSGHGNRHDGFNMMARFSQSMLDLREPSKTDDSAALILRSQQLRRQGHPSPHRHIGQLFQASRSPARDARSKGPKVVIAKPGSFHRPARAAGPVIGGHRYWQSQMLQPDSAQLNTQTRSGRSPRRHSPGNRKTDYTSPHPPANPAGLLGMSFSKLNNFRQLRARGGGASQKKAPPNNKATR
ncbi:protein FAM83G [Sphaeramia orbicularis]|uniref:Protein FAM83G-like n=1 Tax=Sphaeramia orbicularis TaxID=375764 RepID=A0A673A3S4_9TELE|nr:protein FAM83G-like [Sphaeramia orbicularis]